MSFMLDTGDGVIVYGDDATVDGYPLALVGEAQDALAEQAGRDQAATPTGPWFEAGSPEAAFIVLRSVWPDATVDGDAPVFERQADELSLDDPAVRPGGLDSAHE